MTFLELDLLFLLYHRTLLPDILATRGDLQHCQDSKVVEPKDQAVDDMVKVKEGGKVLAKWQQWEAKLMLKPE